MDFSSPTKIHFLLTKCILCPDPLLLCPDPLFLCPQIKLNPICACSLIRNVCNFSDTFPTFPAHLHVPPLPPLALPSLILPPSTPHPAPRTQPAPPSPSCPRPAPPASPSRSHVLHCSLATPDALNSPPHDVLGPAEVRPSFPRSLLSFKFGQISSFFAYTPLFLCPDPPFSLPKAPLSYPEPLFICPDPSPIFAQIPHLPLIVEHTNQNTLMK